MAAPLVQKAFYPFHSFTSGTKAADRVLTYGTAPHRATPSDAVLACAAGSGWGQLELPARHTRDRRRPHDPVGLGRVTTGEAGLTGITVDTANRLQGREFDVTLVWHPLSGRQDASAFHLETGRLCVLLSRHRFACIIVARAGITDLLDRHPRSSPVYLDVPPKFPDGWRAHQVVMDYLENQARP